VTLAILLGPGQSSAVSASVPDVHSPPKLCENALAVRDRPLAHVEIADLALCRAWRPIGARKLSSVRAFSPVFSHSLGGMQNSLRYAWV